MKIQELSFCVEKIIFLSHIYLFVFFLILQLIQQVGQNRVINQGKEMEILEQKFLMIVQNKNIVINNYKYRNQKQIVNEQIRIN
ncbi:unnamed protein product [Paramecium sonneborni]|uniref:Transmembrane protein n=1 Tax=Paramecium sonneborni TaxID=65129 RepID=A0A8S1LY82_9CILI|nr:unnamed protein product [Paramecium sonneborni]